MTIDPHKYVVFNREQLYDVIRDQASTTQDHISVRKIRGIELEDTAVIRLQDRFAPAALQTYSSVVAVAAEMLEGFGSGYPTGTLDDLDELAQYFAELAHRSRHMARKTPD